MKLNREPLKKAPAAPSEERVCSLARKRIGFSLIEVIVALAMLALIAVPAVGLATLAVSRNKELLTTGSATDLKNRVDTALRATEGIDVFATDFVSEANPFVMVASSDLSIIERETETLETGNDEYYRVSVREPEGYLYLANDSYRVLLYEVVWPYKPAGVDRKQLHFTSVFRK